MYRRVIVWLSSPRKLKRPYPLVYLPWIPLPLFSPRYAERPPGNFFWRTSHANNGSYGCGITSRISKSRGARGTVRLCRGGHGKESSLPPPFVLRGRSPSGTGHVPAVTGRHPPDADAGRASSRSAAEDNQEPYTPTSSEAPSYGLGLPSRGLASVYTSGGHPHGSYPFPQDPPVRQGR